MLEFHYVITIYKLRLHCAIIAMNILRRLLFAIVLFDNSNPAGLQDYLI